MNWKCMIVDDEPSARKLLKEFVSTIHFLELVAVCENPIKANTLLQSQHVDIMFLDVNMPKMSGIQFLKTLASPPVSIITSAYSEYALEGFDLNVMDYLVKPFAFERFMKACAKANEYLLLLHKNEAEDATHVNYFFVKCNGRIEKITFDELILIEAKQNYVVLHTTTRKLLIYLTLKGISEKLPPNQFLKIHKSSIINMDKIRNIEGNVVNMGSLDVTISQNLYDTAMKTILTDRMIKR